MHPNIQLARKFSKYYPSPDLPADKNDWHIGHACLEVLEILYPRRDLLIPTMLDSVLFNKELTQKNTLIKDYLTLDITKEFKDISKLYLIEAYASLYRHNFMRNIMWLSGKLKRLKHASDKADEILRRARHSMDFFDMVEKEHVCNCGEMGHMTSFALKSNNVPFQSVCLNFKNKQGCILFDSHCFCLVRTDNKKLTFKQMMADLYHPSTLVVDWWLGKCGHPKEMFELFSNIFVEDMYRKNKKFVSYLKPGTQFLLSSQMIKEGEEDTNDRYIVGHVSSKIPRVFAGENQNTFTPICVPYKEKTIRYPKQITQNQHTLD